MRERRSSDREPMDATVEVVTRERTDRFKLRDRSEGGVLLAAACATPADAPPPCATDLGPELAKLNVPGLAAGIVKDGQLQCTAVAGMADIEANRPVTADTLFLLASTSKTVTATALMTLS